MLWPPTVFCFFVSFDTHGLFPTVCLALATDSFTFRFASLLAALYIGFGAISCDV